MFKHDEALKDLKSYTDSKPYPNNWNREDFLRLFKGGKEHRQVWHTLIGVDVLTFKPGGLFDEGNGELFAYVLHVLDNPHEWRTIEAEHTKKIFDDLPF